MPVATGNPSQELATALDSLALEFLLLANEYELQALRLHRQQYDTTGTENTATSA